VARILIAWEFGAGLGHLTRLLPVAEKLGRDGHHLILAVAELAAAREAKVGEKLAKASFDVRQAPRWPIPKGPEVRQVPTHSLADVFKLIGYHDRRLLSDIAAAWSVLAAEARPDLIIADFCPSLRMVAGHSCPMVVLGNGYTIPPAGRSLPPIRPWEQTLPPASVAAEDEVHSAVNQVASSFGGPGFEHLGDLFSGHRTFVCTVPFFDPYAAYRLESTFDPFNLPLTGPVVPVDRRPPNSAFLYMPGDHPDLAAVLTAVRGLGLEGMAYVPGLPAGIKSRFAGGALQFCAGPQPLGEVLPTVRVLIHHGGLSTAYSGLASATPQLLMTLNLEHLVTARGVAQFGSGIVLSQTRPRDPESLAKALRALTTDPRPKIAAEAAAKSVAARKRAHPLSSILAACGELLAA